MYKITKELSNNGFSINKITDVIERNRKALTFKTLDFFIIYIAFEDSEFVVEQSTIKVPKNHLAFIAPHKNINYTGNSLHDNMVIAFSSSFYEKSVKDSFILNSELFFGSVNECVVVPAIGDEHALRNLIVKRLDLYKEKEHGIYIAVAHNCVEILLLDGLLALDVDSKDSVTSHSSYLEIVNRFRVLLQKHYKTEKSVAFYSDILCVSPQRLSVMTKSVLGKGAKKLVVEKVANEAFKMISNTLLNISEIANELGFVDEANFSTFVKKNLGKSPSDLRISILKSEKTTN